MKNYLSAPFGPCSPSVTASSLSVSRRRLITQSAAFPPLESLWRGPTCCWSAAAWRYLGFPSHWLLTRLSVMIVFFKVPRVLEWFFLRASVLYLKPSVTHSVSSVHYLKINFYIQTPLFFLSVPEGCFLTFVSENCLLIKKSLNSIFR